MSYGIITVKSLLRYTIAKEATNMSTWLELCSFIKRKKDKTSTTKNPKRVVIRSLTIEELKG